MKQPRSIKKPLAREFLFLVRFGAVALVGLAFSVPALACLCSCSIFSKWSAEDTIAAEEGFAKYDQAFSGFVVSTRRVDEPVIDPPVVINDDLVESPGYWIRSRILVLRIWRGAPTTVTEVWTPVFTNCDSSPILGSYFVAIVRLEDGRSVARNSSCDCPLIATATKGPETIAAAGAAITVAAVGAAAFALFALARVVRRRRLLRDSAG